MQYKFIYSLNHERCQLKSIEGAYFCFGMKVQMRQMTITVLMYTFKKSFSIAKDICVILPTVSNCLYSASCSNLLLGTVVVV